MNLSAFLNPDYLFSMASGTTYEAYYLYFSLAIILIPIILKIYFRLASRLKVYKSFDSLWFWGYLTVGLLGLFIWFSRSQGLPTFSIRFFSYLWLFSIFFYAVYLAYYYKKKVATKIPAHYEKERKEKYLK